MATFVLSLPEILRTAGLRRDVLAILQKHASIAAATLNKKLYVPADGGFRTSARQLQLFQWRQQDAAAGDVYATAAPGTSYHELGAAYDLRIVDGTADDYDTLAQIGRSLGMRWGPDIGAKGDIYHYQTAETLDVARQKFVDHVRGSLLVLGLVGVGCVALLNARRNRGTRGGGARGGTRALGAGRVDA